MIRRLALLPLLLASLTAAPREKPAQLEWDALKLPSDLPEAPRKLVADALTTARDLQLSAYIFGSADPDQGGFDCSGSMVYLLHRAGLEPPRSSSAQFDWIEASGNLVHVPPGARDLTHPAFNLLQPGDLIFWSGTYQPTDGRTNGVTHVQMFLGWEKDGRPVMIGSTDGRSYRGVPRCGFGVYDLRVPRADSKSRLVGYGTPPGLLP
ncbi:cell wall-associated NlpC family hydrolase [Haloferula luteola]|uniref:Cell wall-associated NlpC family hydrolase n=1 Tax=Haloferula luteola TaxID=595692 RepID=A0A840V4X0_9BACT|nr:NlpC/P60 family protein [Haloferula luteola]MBB5352623.1 cell wall-associated NlpC family hydrolase [Haloferula luteola]